MEEKTTEISHEPQTAQQKLLSFAIGVGLIIFSVYLMKKAIEIWKS